MNDRLLCPTPPPEAAHPTARWIGTIKVSLCRWDKDLYASDPTTRDGFDWSDAHLLILPILSRNPMGFDDCQLSHERQ